MGNASTTGATNVTLSAESLRERLSSTFFFGSMKELHLFSLEVGLCFGRPVVVVEENGLATLTVAGLMRQSSWRRRTALYVFTLTLVEDEKGGWSGSGEIEFDGPAQGWASVHVRQHFTSVTLDTATMTLSGWWNRNEDRRDGGSSETLSTSGSFSFALCGKALLSDEERRWSPQKHNSGFSDPLFRSQVLCLLMLRARPDSLFHLLPRDVLHLLIGIVAEGSPPAQFHSRFAELMHDAEEGLDEEELRRRLSNL